MKKQRQAVSMAMDIARRAERAQGGRMAYAEGGSASNRNMSRAISDRAMRGLDPTPEQQRYLDEMEGLKGERSETLGSLGAELTGIPSLVRGAKNMKRGYDEGDAIRAGGGAFEAILGAAPAGAAVRPLGSLVAPFVRTLPRTIGTTTAATGLSAYSDDANAAEKNVATAIDGDPEVKSLMTERQKAFAEIERVNRQHARSGPKTQEQALLPYQKEIERLNTALEAAKDRARQKYMDQATFREKYPGAPTAIMGAGLALAGGLPLVKQFGERVADAKWRAPAIKTATEDARAAFASGASDADTAVAQTLLRKKLDAWDKSHGAAGTAGAYVGNTLKGGFLGAEASQLPEQIDYIANPPGHPAREKATALFRSPEYWNDRLAPTLLGAGIGVTSTGIGKMIPQNKEFLTPARELAERGEAPSFWDKAVGMFSKKGPQGPTEEALERVRNYRNAVGPSDTPLDEIAASTGNKLPAADAASPLPTVPGSIVDASLPGASQNAARPGLAERMRAQDQLLGPVETPSPPVASAAPEVRYVPVPVRVSATGRMNYGKGVPEELGVMPGKFVKSEHRPPKEEVPRKKASSKKADKGTKKSESIQADEIPQKPDMPIGGDFGPFARGGVVGRAIEIARNMGGRVLTGPVTHRADGGRTDTVKTNLPSNSYVVPADIISSLGEGDTNAGYKVLEAMFGTHETAGDTGEIPAIVAGGEYVLSPEQVARIGNGDPDMAFQALDQWVKMQRRKHIQTLKSLPAPVKD
jgi:hypothetical protein